MFFHIRHELNYRYSQPVFLEPQLIRLRPQSDIRQRLLQYNLVIDPQPAGLTHLVDLYGNDSTLVWFGSLTDKFSLVTESSTQVIGTNPFDYLITQPGLLHVPSSYRTIEHRALEIYLHRNQPSAAVDEFAREVVAASGGQTMEFLWQLTQRLCSDTDQEIRTDGAAWPPEHTLQTRSGACRDLAVLFMDACRSVGLAARFVSGYKHTPDLDGERHLHAWAEVYLTGAGWRGYDPSIGLAVTDDHLVLAVGPEPEDAAPTVGTFRGPQVTTELDFSVTIDFEPSLPESC